MPISKQYDPSDIEDKWYKHWIDRGYFHSEPDDREPYTIVIPPPNVTGVLHMGHILNNTIQDILIRKARLQGKNACWVPGTDHASIATEAKVVKKLASDGIKKWDISRDEFLSHAWEWTHTHGGIILQQLKKLGASCDWDRTRFTMDDELSESVIDVFIDLYQKGYIYKGKRMVNWDPKALTALSDEEVIHKEQKSKLYYVKYQIEGTQDEWLTIATTRPETILGDTAICINPKDERYRHLSGKRAIVPLVERSVPIIEDEYVDIAFGTGCLKVTPAHDPNDYELGQKHHLEIIDTINANGTMSEAAQFFVGEDRFVARKKIVAELEKHSHLVKVEDYDNKVAYSERTNEVIEPRLSEQWFMNMKEISKPALEHVLDGTIQFHPSKFINTYRYWLENVRDWCISRQLWWGQRIPAWYNEAGEYVVCKTAKEAQTLFAEKFPASDIRNIRQDEDVMDTWFSSWLWPISVFDGIRHPGNKDINYYYPTNDLVTAPDILFFWVARMIIAGYEFRDKAPFKHVYFTGMVRDKQGRKMSKSLGNSPNPLDMIEQFGADAVRMGMLLSSPAGNDLLYDDKLIIQGRNFCNKIWNALRLVKGWKAGPATMSNPNQAAIHWFEHKLQHLLPQLEKMMSEYRISEALMSLYNFIRDDYCSWYLEMVKPAFEQNIDAATLKSTIRIFEDLMRLLHPFMPFITEEIWHLLRDRKAGDDLVINHWPQKRKADTHIIQQGDTAREIISKVREIRNQQQIKPKEPLQLFVETKDFGRFRAFEAMIKKLAVLDVFEATEQAPDKAFTFIADRQHFQLVANLNIDPAKEKERLEKELEYARGFIRSVEAKLINANFVDHAPEKVIEKERKKLADGQQKLEAILHSLKQL